MKWGKLNYNQIILQPKSDQEINVVHKKSSMLAVETVLHGFIPKHGFGILTWKHVGTQKISTQNSKLVVSRRSLYASGGRGCIINYTTAVNHLFSFTQTLSLLTILNELNGHKKKSLNLFIHFNPNRPIT